MKAINFFVSPFAYLKVRFGPLTDKNWHLQHLLSSNTVSDFLIDDFEAKTSSKPYKLFNRLSRNMFHLCGNCLWIECAKPWELAIEEKGEERNNIMLNQPCSTSSSQHNRGILKSNRKRFVLCHRRNSWCSFCIIYSLSIFIWIIVL